MQDVVTNCKHPRGKHITHIKQLVKRNYCPRQKGLTLTPTTGPVAKTRGSYCYIISWWALMCEFVCLYVCACGEHNDIVQFHYQTFFAWSIIIYNGVYLFYYIIEDTFVFVIISQIIQRWSKIEITLTNQKRETYICKQYYSLL